MRIFTNSILLLASLSTISFVAYAEEGDMSLGMYGNVVVSSTGTPSNDVLGVGLTGSYQLENSWFVDLELIQSEADFERPWKVLGLQQDTSVKTVDAVYSSNVVMVQIGQNIKSDSEKYNWYWSAGLGFNSIDVDDVSGQLDGGGTFNIKTTTNTEAVLGLKAGIKQHLSDNWNINYALRVNRHFADWTVTETVSNTTAKIDDYALYGILIGVEKRF